MSKFKDLTQLSLSNINWIQEKNRENNPWKGKVIERAGFIDKDENLLIIIFSDKTFLAVELEHVDDDEIAMTDAFMYDITDQAESEVKYGGCWVDDKDNVHLSLKIRMMVDLGLWEFTEEDAAKVLKNSKKKTEDYEYNLYLKLKEKFENKDEERRSNKS